MKNIFVKVSGDLYERNDFVDWISELSKENLVVICVGGGTQINKAFGENGITADKYGALGRQHKNREEQEIAKKVLDNNKNDLEKILESKNIEAKVIIPFFDIETVWCHVNGDQMVRTVYLGFDKIFVVTLESRLENKEDQFKELPKVAIKSFTD